MIINKTNLGKYSPLPQFGNYDFSEILNYVPVAEKIWIQPLIGDDLYNELEEQISTNTVSEQNAALLTDGGLWQYLSYATVLEGLPFVWANISSVGITLGKSDNSDSITLKDLTYVQQHLRSQVEYLKDYTKKWLCERSDVFPTLDCCKCGCSCCNDNAKLNKPNPYQQLYTTLRKNTRLR